METVPRTSVRFLFCLEAKFQTIRRYTHIIAEFKGVEETREPAIHAVTVQCQEMSSAVTGFIEDMCKNWTDAKFVEA